MSKFVEFPLEGGGSIVIESADEPTRTPSGFLRAGEGGSDAANRAQGTFDDSVESVRRSAELLVSKLRSLSAPPDELEISFSLKASSETASLVVGKAGSDANFGVLLRWRSDKAEKDGEGDDGRRAKSEQSSDDPGEHYQQRKRRTLPPAQAPRPAEEDDDDDQDDEDRLQTPA